VPQGLDETGSRGSDSDVSPRQRSWLASSAVMALGTLVSRVLGMARALLLAWALGLLTLSSNAFATANTVPNSVYMLIAGGVLNAVLVPQLTRAAREPDGGRGQVDRLFTLCVIGLSVTTGVVILLAPFVPAVLARDFDGETAALTVSFAYLCLPQVFFYGLYMVFGQLLNARGIFGPFMWAPAVNNVVAIAGVLTFVAAFGADAGRQGPGDWTFTQVAVLAGTSTAGVAAQALILLVPLRRAGITPRLRLTRLGQGTGRAGRIAGWTLGAALVSQLGYVVTSNVSNSAAAEGEAGRTVYDNAYLLFMLPHSLITVSVVTALFTRISRSAAAGDIAAVGADISRGLRVLGVGTVLSAAAMITLAPYVVRVLYPGNSDAEVDALALAASIMAVGLPAMGAQHLLQRGFYAFEDARTPFLIQIAVVGVSTAAALTGASVLPARLAVPSVATGLSLGLLTGALISASVLRRRIGDIDGRRVAGAYVRLIAAAAAAAAVTVPVTSAVTRLGDSFGVHVLALAAGGLALLVTYLLSCHLLRVREVRTASRLLTERLGR
jgi:putative peptidoglycan lipid II flippase